MSNNTHVTNICKQPQLILGIFSVMRTLCEVYLKQRDIVKLLHASHNILLQPLITLWRHHNELCKYKAFLSEKCVNKPIDIVLLI